MGSRAMGRSAPSRSSVLATVCVLVVGCVAGCTRTGVEPGSDSPHAHATGTPRAGGVHPRRRPATPSPVPPQVAETRRVRLPATGATTVGHSSRGWLVPASDGGGGRLTRVLLVSPRTGRTRTVVRSGFPHGMINWAVGVGDWIAWVDQSREQSDTAADVSWRVLVRNLETGRTRLLSSNGDRPDPFVPEVFAGGDHLVWATAEHDRSAHQWVWSPREGRRSLLRHADLNPFTESVSRRSLVYWALRRWPGRPTSSAVTAGSCR